MKKETDENPLDIPLFRDFFANPNIPSMEKLRLINILADRKFHPLMRRDFNDDWND